MIKNIKKTSEFDHFTDLAKEWWDRKGKFKILHSITPLRIKYIRNIIASHSKKNNNLKILDLGCGGGLVCEPLSRLGANVTGVDFVLSNIKVAKLHAKKSNLNIEYLHQDLNNLKITKKYDLILMLEILEHIDNWEKLIKKVKKNLKSNGKIIISTINRNIYSKFFAIFIAEEILRWVPKKTHKYNKLIKPNELTYVLKKNKFDILDITGLTYKPISMEWSLNKKNYKINYFCSALNIN